MRTREPKKSCNSLSNSVSTEGHVIEVHGLPVRVVRKAIKNLHIGVYPPDGHVRVAAPSRMSDDAVRLAVIGKLGWLRRHRGRFMSQPRQSARQMVSGESHYYLGRRYNLRVLEDGRVGRVVLHGNGRMELCVPRGATVAYRTRVLQSWYRRRLRELVPPIVAQWEDKLDAQVSHVGIKRMKTKWGSCSAPAHRIWLNLELAKKPARCLEYVIVHEMAHLLERRHDDRFVAILDQHMPRWRQHRDELNSTPLRDEVWQRTAEDEIAIVEGRMESRF
jgi:predicted metal-dependent hydrolase